MRTKILTAFVAGGLLVGAGLVASVISPPGTALAREESDDAMERGPVPRILGFLDDVLDGLVDDGTITQDQADAIVAATEEKANELRDERMALRDDNPEVLPHRLRDPFKRGFRLGAFLDDGGIDQEEYDSLADDNPLKQADLSEYLGDGLITPDELRQAFAAHMESRFGDDA